VASPADPVVTDSDVAEACLSKSRVHQDWIKAYRNSANEKFFSLAFDLVARNFERREGSVILDAGCGTCSHSIRLAERGFTVRGVDISVEMLKVARDAVKERGLSDRIEVLQGNLRSLPFGDDLFSGVLCWGVLMHVPDATRALAELCRVLAPGGRFVIGENNLYSLQSLMIWGLRKVLKRGTERLRRTPEGLENWYPIESGILLTRETDIGWLVNECRKNGLHLRKRIAGQTSDFYTWVSSPILKKLVHLLNLFWFRYVGIPYLAHGNILVFEKQ